MHEKHVLSSKFPMEKAWFVQGCLPTKLLGLSECTLTVEYTKSLNWKRNPNDKAAASHVALRKLLTPSASLWCLMYQVLVSFKIKSFQNKQHTLNSHFLALWGGENKEKNITKLTGDGVLRVLTLAKLTNLEFYREWYTDGKSKHPECQFMKSF